MPKKRLLVLTVVVGFLISACASAVKSESLSDNDLNGGGEVKEEIDGPAGEGLESEGDSEQDLEKDTPSPSAQEEGPKVDETTCEDPFDGEQPAFNTAYWEKTNFCEHSVDYSTIFSGGPPPDGIPPIDDPIFVSLESVDGWLKDREPVISLQIDGDARAYPLQIMTWHEIVNDKVGGVPVVVTFCPLCNTALVFERPSVNGQILTFGTSGNLRNSDLVMYDRQTESWWQQFSGEAIVGDLTGQQLKFLPATIVSWSDFKNEHPEGEVLSRETGFNRRYGSNPYVGYDDIDSSPFLFQGDVDERLKPMERVVGILGEGDQSKSFSYQRLQEERLIHETFEGTPIVVFWKEGTASALDTSTISEGKDVGTTGVFEALVEGEELTFTADEDGTFRDKKTNSTWNILGEAVEGPLAGETLTAIPHHDTFWFAWAAFQPPDSLMEE